jgi:hypothetical protein
MVSVTEPDEDWFDPDIAAMKLGYGEKAGLQIYRNYTRSFEEHAIKKFVEQCACPDAVWKTNISGGVEFQSRINSWMCAGSTFGISASAGAENGVPPYLRTRLAI